jgi:hypothetical protein
MNPPNSIQAHLARSIRQDRPAPMVNPRIDEAIMRTIRPKCGDRQGPFAVLEAQARAGRQDTSGAKAGATSPLDRSAWLRAGQVVSPSVRVQALKSDIRAERTA